MTNNTTTNQQAVHVCVEIGQVESFNFSIESSKPMNSVIDIFNKNPALPGIIITKDSQFIGVITRARCFEAFSKPYGVEIYSKMRAIDFHLQFGINPLIFESNILIQDAAVAALSRNLKNVYEPVIIRSLSNMYTLVDMHTLLLAQSDEFKKLFSEFQKLAYRDTLTNLNNRRGFFELAQPEVIKTSSIRGQLSALMIDIDHFKFVNDMYGHLAGDRVIQVVADECKKCCRDTDLIGRFGGEEFFILLPNTPLEQAEIVAERIRSKIESTRTQYNSFEISVTVSIGVSNEAVAGVNLDQLLSKTDQALLYAKTHGRNTVYVWTPKCSQKIRVSNGFIGIKKSRGAKASHSNVPINSIYDETIEGWAHALELRDRETRGHAKRVEVLTVLLARKMGVKESQISNIRRGALLHDIGKIAIPDSILFKPGPLDDQEWELMKKHPIYAFELLSPIKFLNDCVEIPYCHHEYWDGSGYPRGLEGKTIPIGARIFTIIDVWDALGSERCYRKAWHRNDIMEYIKQESGRKFDPQIVNFFLDVVDEMDTKPISEVSTNDQS